MTAGVVLAGGRSRRMGTDKALLARAGTTLLGHVLDALAAAVDGPLLVVGAADADRPLPPDTDRRPWRSRVRVVHDPVPGRGPLQGLATGLGAAADDGADTAFVASVDLPHLHAPFVRAVLAHRVGTVEVALPVLDGHRQPLLAAYATALGARAADLVARGELRPGALLAASRVVELDAATLLADPALAARDPGLRAAQGVNTPDEWARATREPPGPAT
ncbi:molybdenum cofactor guanylyltransferase [Actinomycetospora cinnamomea]|uniref:Molybdopterin-guanine dinucleotide biosynthesis protein A n=1 Tax=Actinomycetospora cinnamomea TaxID=663609 RepID=A0A2U1FBB5_9PSEU|nr:molybdenum cofactor guanylyltransferase [Actinomycetospora cinnamomea]PVZ09477.1 molybdopterin-guanine dinucleotide biosynthesis protein A [Actinomycetospora cinnamomea]